MIWLNLTLNQSLNLLSILESIFYVSINPSVHQYLSIRDLGDHIGLGIINSIIKERVSHGQLEKDIKIIVDNVSALGYLVGVQIFWNRIASLPVHFCSLARGEDLRWLEVLLYQFLNQPGENNSSFRYDNISTFYVYHK